MASKKYPLVFVDTETTSLLPDREVWEIAMIRRDLDGHESQVNLMVKVDLVNADPVSLDIGKFWERHPQGVYWKKGFTPAKPKITMAVSRVEAAAVIFALTFETQLVGAIPSFDAHGMETLLRREGFLPKWHHRLICVESLTSGFYHRNVGGLSSCMEELGLTHIDEHTAMGDTIATMKIYDAIIKNDQ